MPALKTWKNKELQRIKLESDQMFESLCSCLGLPSLCEDGSAPSIQMDEDHDRLLITLHLAGINAGDIEINVDGNTLCVHYDMKNCSECSVYKKSHKTCFTLPCKVRSETLEVDREGENILIHILKCRRGVSKKSSITISMPDA